MVSRWLTAQITYPYTVMPLNWVWRGISLWFWFAFPWWLMSWTSFHVLIDHLFVFFCPFLNWVVILLVSSKSSLYILTLGPLSQGSPTFRHLIMPDDLRWSWYNINSNKVHNKCNGAWIIPRSTPPAMEKLSWSLVPERLSTAALSDMSFANIYFHSIFIF